MQPLIEKLKQEHVELSDIFLEVVLLDITSEVALQKLRAAKAALLAHLQYEEAEFYPILEEMAQDNPDLQLKLASFADDMYKVSKTVLEFFEKYAVGQYGEGFQRDFRYVYAQLTQRIRREESELFPEYAYTQL